MRLLITGASGFIGTNAIAFFAGLTDHILNLDIQAPLDAAQQKYWQKVDILDQEELVAAFTAFAPTHCIHMAARTECDEKTTVEEGYGVNTKGTEQVLAAVKACPSLERLIVVSSQFVCGPGPLPASDTDYYPHTVYGQSKVVTEQLTRAAGLDCVWTIVRP
ncbi:MAG: NAD-dependent epimerase/dehydratase family protein, partial [Kiritimatiellia bacterium]